MATSDDSSYEDASNAFGAGSGASSSSSVTAAAVPAGGDGPRRRSERWIPLTIVLLSLVGTGLALWRAERGALADPVKQGERGAVQGIDGRSLLRAQNLRRAFDAVSADVRVDEVVTDVQISPVLVRLSVRDANGHARIIDTNLAFKTSSRDAGLNPSDGPALAQLDVSAPGRLVATALQRGGFPARAVTDVGWSYNAGAERKQTWTLTLHDVPIADQTWEADATAATVRRTSDPVPAEPARPEPEQPTPAVATPKPKPTPARPKPTKRTSTPPRSNAVTITVNGTRVITDPQTARRIAACIRRAGTKRVDIIRCIEPLR
ncbi:MAG: hypothetical protein JWO02_564 [Solirubrobacterales bacterium]|nr:hypothetical protein [Solirubrobacterales bacterium]